MKIVRGRLVKNYLWLNPLISTDGLRFRTASELTTTTYLLGGLFLQVHDTEQSYTGVITVTTDTGP